MGETVKITCKCGQGWPMDLSVLHNLSHCGKNEVVFDKSIMRTCLSCNHAEVLQAGIKASAKCLSCQRSYTFKIQLTEPEILADVSHDEVVTEDEVVTDKGPTEEEMKILIDKIPEREEPAIVSVPENEEKKGTEKSDKDDGLKPLAKPKRLLGLGKRKKR